MAKAEAGENTRRKRGGLALIDEKAEVTDAFHGCLFIG